VPYTGPSKDNNKGLGNQAVSWPDTSSGPDACTLPSNSATHHSACCADMSGNYCHTCPRNSCHSDGKANRIDPNRCPAGITANTDCACDDEDVENDPAWASFKDIETFNYDKSYFRVCVPQGATAAPTARPTKVPTKNPTKEPLPNFCAAGYFWNGAAPLLGAGIGQMACNHAIWGNKNMNSAPNNKDPNNWGPMHWSNGKPKDGCRGRCEQEYSEDNVGQTCKEDWSMAELHDPQGYVGSTTSDGSNEYPICVTADDGGWRYWEADHSKDPKKLDYMKANCMNKSGSKTTYTDCCSKMVTWDEGKSFCEAVGGRLCTEGEIRNSCAERTGCDYDYTWVWTATPCTLPSGIKKRTGGGPDLSGSAHIAAPGDHRKWARRDPGQCYFKDNKNDAMSGHKACQEVPKNKCTNQELHKITKQCYAQGMPNTGDGIPYTGNGASGTGQLTGFGEAVDYPIAKDWYKDKNKARMKYTEAMMQLFGWTYGDNKHKDGFIEYNKTPDDRPDPTKDLTYGRVCLPDSGEYKVFTRCCANEAGNAGKLENGKYLQKNFCVACPKGFTNEAGEAQDFYTCVCELPKTVDAFGNCS